MANAKDITGSRTNILLIGDSGTWKTGFTGGVPGIYVFDFDAGMATLRGRDIPYDTFKDLAKLDASGKPLVATPWHLAQGLHSFGSGWDAFYKKFLEIGQLIEKGDPAAPKAISFDSLTHMSSLAVNKILKDTGHPAPHQGTWGAHHEYFKTIFSMATAWPIRLIATCHIQRDQNDLTQTVEKLPLLAGKMAGFVSTFFDEVYFCESEVQADGKQKFFVKTKATPSMRQAKSRFGVPDNTPTDFAAISKYFPSGTVPPSTVNSTGGTPK